MTELNIYERLSKIMEDVSYIQKEKASKGLPFNFVSHDSVIKAVRPSFLKHGVVISPSVREHSKEGNCTIAVVDVDFVNIKKPDDKISVSFFGYGVDKQDKGPGKAISYAVKYSLLKVLMLETGDDPENDNLDAVGNVISDAQNINLREICDSKGFPADETLSSLAQKVYKLKKIEDLPEKLFDDAISRIESKS